MIFQDFYYRFMKLYTDRSLILNDIRFHYKFKNNAEFARFLEITPQNLSNWYKRNTFDIEKIYTKCEGINPTWLLTGKGQMFLSATEIEKDQTNIEDLRKLLASKDKIIALYEEKIKSLESDKEDRLAVISAQNQVIIEHLESQDIEKTIKEAKQRAAEKMKSVKEV